MSMEKTETLLAKAAILLQDLTEKAGCKQAKMGRFTGLPASEVSACAGLAFVFAFKAGVVVSWTHGRGFLLRKLGKESGARTKWSAPLLFTVNAAGAGATLGVTEIASVLVLDTPEACCAFLRTQVTLDAELGASAGSRGGQVDVTAANVTCPRESFHSFSYSRVSRGLMIDVSWNGVGVRVDVEGNDLLYGGGTPPAAILSGDVAQPMNLVAPLLKVLSGVLARTSPRSTGAQKAKALAGAAHVKHLPGTVVAQPRIANKPHAGPGPTTTRPAATLLAPSVVQAGPPRAARVTFAVAAPVPAAGRAEDAGGSILAPLAKQVAPSGADPRVACAPLPQARVACAASPVAPTGAQMAPIGAQVPLGVVPGTACSSAARAAGGVVDAEVVVRQGRRLLTDEPAWDQQPGGVSQGESPPDIVAQLRALSPFAALTHIPIADL